MMNLGATYEVYEGNKVMTGPFDPVRSAAMIPRPSAFQRIPSSSITSPPGLIHHHDSEEDDEDSLPSLSPSSSSFYVLKHVRHEQPLFAVGGQQTNSGLQPAQPSLSSKQVDDGDVVFQLDVTARAFKPTILTLSNTNAAPRHRHRPRLYHPKMRPITRISLPRRGTVPPITKPLVPSPPSPLLPPPSSFLSHHRSSTTSVTAARPTSTRSKGPCQACQESSDGCMRKAFNWPFPSNAVFHDKGRPYVYLCNKCGLRYNKSGGCVCRHCRWVFCKEEKRKAMLHIAYMRRLRPDGRVDPNEDIADFVCSPKYWACGRPWKVGWVLRDEVDDDAVYPSRITC